MSDRPAPPPEGQVLTAALRKAGLTAREAARRTGISEGRWRQIVSGYQRISGQYVPISGPAATIARMAAVAGVSPDELERAGRGDAARELRTHPPAEDSTSEAPEATWADALREMEREFTAHETFREEAARRIELLEAELREMRGRIAALEAALLRLGGGAPAGANPLDAPDMKAS